MFRIALLQIVGVDNDVAANLSRGLSACREAKALGADIALFPEMWSINYELGWERPVDWRPGAIARDSEWLNRFRALAAELEMAIAVTYLETWPGAPRNSLTLIDRGGRDVLTHAKAHLCDWGPEGELTAGEALETATLDTASGPVRVGAMICYDREFPETARTLMLKGAEVILSPNSCDVNTDRIAQLRGQAYENMLAVALANYPKPKNNGRSIAFDGMPGEPDGPERDMLVVEGGRDPAIVIADIDIDKLRAYRTYEALGQPKGRYRRRPELYAVLGEAGATRA
jgi:N-carbamoylputrescine amidase